MAETVTCFEVDQPFCTKTFGVTCTGHLASTGIRKCFNTRSTCHDPLNYEQESYLLMTGASGQYASTPDIPANSITGDIDIRARVMLTDWTPAAYKVLVAKWDSGVAQNRSFVFYVEQPSTGILGFGTSPDGINVNPFHVSTVPVPAADGAIIWVRVTLDINDGLGNQVCKFYTSQDGITWTQLGSTSTIAGAVTIFDSGQPLLIGSEYSQLYNVSGKVYYADVRDGIDGMVVAQFDPKRAEKTGALTFKSRLGETWTANGTASLVCGFIRLRFVREGQEGLERYGNNLLPLISADPSVTPGTVNLGGLDRNMAALGKRESVKVAMRNARHSDLIVDKYRLERSTGIAAQKYLSLPGTAGNYASTPDSVANSVLGDLDIRVRVALDDWTPADFTGLFTKWSAGTYGLWMRASGALDFQWKDNGGTGFLKDSTVPVGTVNGVANWIRVILDVNNGAAGNDVKFYTSNDYNPGDGSGTWTQLGATVTTAGTTTVRDTAEVLIVGAYNGGSSGMAAGKFYYAELRNGIGGTVVARFDPQGLADGAAGTFAAPGTGETWTINTSGSPASRITAVEMYDPSTRGSFWGKWAARNTYFSSYPCRLRNGTIDQTLEQMSTRDYVLDKFEGPGIANSITAKDIFSKLESRKAVVPLPSTGELNADIAASGVANFTIVPAGIGASYLASGYVCIGHEIIEYTRSGDVLTVVNRAALGTLADLHKQEDLVQQVYSAVGVTAVNLAYDWLANYSEIGTLALPKPKWDVAAASLIDVYTVRIAKPTPVAQLLGELSEQAALTWYADPELGEVTLVPLRSADTSITVDDSSWIVGGTSSVKTQRQDSRRVSQVSVHYGLKDPTGDVEDPANFHSRVTIKDVEAESPEQYGVTATRDVFSRFIAQFGRPKATAVGDRIITMFRNPPIEAKFSIHHSRRGALKLAKLFYFSTEDVQDEVGLPKVAAHALVSMQGGEFVLNAASQEVFFATPIPPGTETNISIENDSLNLSLRDIYDSQYVTPTGGEVVTFTVLPSITVGSNSNLTPAIKTGSWPAGVTLKLINQGRIQGKGGRGASWGGGDGEAGGPALEATVTLIVDNTLGEIWSGGGGGGHGSRGDLSLPGGQGATYHGAGGGAGQGYLSNAGGLPSPSPSGLTYDIVATAGGSSTKDTAGAAGVGNTDGSGRFGGSGGVGGAAGQVGGNGTSFSGGGLTLAGPAQTNGGATGNYIVGNSFVTWLANGDRRGGVA